MSEERKMVRRQFSREGVDTFSEVSAFLGGIFFTSLLIVVQQREKFDVTLLELNLQVFTIRVGQLHLIAIPLSISVILFIFSSIFFAGACSQVLQSDLERLANRIARLFALGILSMFVSLFTVLFLLDIIVGVIGIISTAWIFIWWGKK